MSDSRNMRTLEVLTITSILAWKVICPNEAPATQLAFAQPTGVRPASSTPSGTRTTAHPELKLSDEQAKQAVAELRSRRLLFPITGFNPERVKNSYNETRGNQLHEAVDILAPRNTPIMAVEDGTIAKLFLSKPGGITIYEFDPSKRFIYYYAHLEKYADGLKDGETVKRGQVIGFVGTSGDAPPDTPHLHFSISMPGAEKKWWQTAPLNPYLVFKNQVK
jgi:murein DD-endopeptidase MepM/ murein hydrolase activator NlpD